METIEIMFAKQKYFDNLKKEHLRKLKTELRGFVTEETLESPVFAKKARQRFLRKRILDLVEKIIDLKKTVRNKKAGVLRFLANDNIKEIAKDLKRAVWEYKNTFNTKQTKTIDDTMIERAKEYPMGELVEIKKNKFLCPWHDDHNPSCHYYEKSNTCYCHACHNGGDVIDLYQQISKVDFPIAVKNLN